MRNIIFQRDHHRSKIVLETENLFFTYNVGNILEAQNFDPFIFNFYKNRDYWQFPFATLTEFRFMERRWQANCFFQNVYLEARNYGIFELFKWTTPKWTSRACHQPADSQNNGPKRKKTGNAIRREEEKIKTNISSDNDNLSELMFVWWSKS